MRYKPKNEFYRYFVLNKPFQMLSQFSREGKYRSLADIDFSFPNDVYPVGRLDADSEGLLLLTNDASVNKKLLAPENNHTKKYWVQVDGAITDNAITQLENGVDIKVKGKVHRTKASNVSRLNESQVVEVPARVPAVRFRKNIPTSWIQIELTEGKNRQIRRMTANVGFPTLRIIRVQIEKLKLDDLYSGEVKELSQFDFFNLLNI